MQALLPGTGAALRRGAPRETGRCVPAASRRIAAAGVLACHWRTLVLVQDKKRTRERDTAFASGKEEEHHKRTRKASHVRFD